MLFGVCGIWLNLIGECDLDFVDVVWCMLFLLLCVYGW